ncbi:MAG: hypothetical protein EBS68_17050 [Rhodobacteraceae bacterium]|nr:hypothetical protein [Paracoccaceae bacterium]
MALLAHTESASKTDGGGGLFLSSKATPKSLASIIKDGARLMVTPALAERIISECFYAPQEARDVGGSRHIAILAAYRSWVKYGEAYFAAVTGCSGSFVKRFNRTGVLAVGMS